MSSTGKVLGGLLLMGSLANSSLGVQITTGGLITPYFLANPGNSSYGGVFTLAGYDPVNQQIDSASASFAFSDGSSEDNASEKVDITLGGLLLLDDQEVDGTHRNVPHSYAWYPASLTGQMIADLADGNITYFVQLLDLRRNKDNTWLKGAKLVVEVSHRTPPAETNVPDGGCTVGLLGLAMTGLAWLRRKG